MHTPSKSNNIAGYLGIALALIALAGSAWNVTAAWFRLVERVTVLETEGRYLHGDVDRFINQKETR